MKEKSALVAGALFACTGFNSPVESNCRWIEDGQIEIDWQPGERCRNYCSAHPFKFSPTDPAHPDYVLNECRTFDCYSFARDEHTHVQVWRDPTAGFAANLGPEDWWTRECSP